MTIPQGHHTSLQTLEAPLLNRQPESEAKKITRIATKAALEALPSEVCFATFSRTERRRYGVY
jgi:hypothetical protein